MSSVNHNRRTGLSSPRANLAAAFGQIPESILLILNDLHKSIRQITASLPKPTASREPAADCQSILPAATPSAAGAVGRTSWPASAFSTFFEVLSKQMWRRHSCLQRRDFRGSDLCRASRRLFAALRRGLSAERSQDMNEAGTLFQPRRTCSNSPEWAFSACRASHSLRCPAAELECGKKPGLNQSRLHAIARWRT